MSDSSLLCCILCQGTIFGQRCDQDSKDVHPHLVRCFRHFNASFSMSCTAPHELHRRHSPEDATRSKVCTRKAALRPYKFHTARPLGERRAQPAARRVNLSLMKPRWRKPRTDARAELRFIRVPRTEVHRIGGLSGLGSKASLPDVHLCAV